jgi:hypothetical protein
VLRPHPRFGSVWSEFDSQVSDQHIRRTMIHACYVTDEYYDGFLWKCEACDFGGHEEDAIAHAVKHQFIVRSNGSM